MKVLKFFLFMSIVALLCSCSDADKYKELAKSGTKATISAVYSIGNIHLNGDCSCLVFENGTARMVEDYKIANLGLKKGTKIIYELYNGLGDIEYIMIDSSEGENPATPIEEAKTPEVPKDSLIIEK